MRNSENNQSAIIFYIVETPASSGPLPLSIDVAIPTRETRTRRVGSGRDAVTVVGFVRILRRSL